MGCDKCRLPLNICNTQGVQPKGLGGWIYVTCDNPACKAVNKISIGKQLKPVSKKTIHSILLAMDMQFLMLIQKQQQECCMQILGKLIPIIYFLQ